MSQPTKAPQVVLVGFPNCGKSTIFNALTGGTAKVGNWSGVTVDVKHGCLDLAKQTTSLIDLPGITTLTHLSEEQSLDSHVVHKFLRENHADVIINVLDVSHLQTQLYLTLQLCEMGVPMVVAVNMMDQLDKSGSQLQLECLSELLGCPVVPLVGSRRKGLAGLKKNIMEMLEKPLAASPIQYPPLVEQAIETLMQEGHCQRWQAIQCLCGDFCVLSELTGNQKQLLSRWQSSCGAQLGQEVDLLIIDTMYTWINKQMPILLQGTPKSSAWTDRLDALALHRFLGIPIFIMVMYGLFVFAISLVGGLQDSVGLLTEWLWVDGTTVFLHGLDAPEWLVHILAEGIGRGINTTLTFLPVLLGIYLYLAFLEGSGYMPRAAFVMDRLMRFLGLPGKAFVPLIIGFGCNVPAVMATRTLASPKDRLMTSMMVPFMSCSARLAIFSVFAGAFFPEGGQNVIFCLYLLGIGVAIFTGWLLRRILTREAESPLLMTFPAYHWPRPEVMLRQVYWRVLGFVKRAGRIIIPLSLILSLLTLPAGKSAQPVLHAVSKSVTVLLNPMGIEEDNWPATVGLVSGIIAKEVVIGTLNTLYTHDDKSNQLGQGFGQEIKEYAAWEAKGTQVRHAFTHALGWSSGTSTERAEIESAMGRFALYFHNDASVFSYLLFVLLYFPCLSTLAVIVREVSKPWAIISVFWATGLAYVFAIACYQLLTISAHVGLSMAWLTGCVASVYMGYRLLLALWQREVLGLRTYG